tara:strand:+ start:6361 stop:6624 length:264 start_codon:yes stop_codon:yes gene_type:complete
MSQEYVKIGDVADEFSVSVSTIRKWIRENKIPRNTYIKAGRTYRFSIDEVTKALRGAGESTPTWQEELADQSPSIGIASLEDLDEDF